MITQSQKDELSEKLGYSKDEIKKLKPTEAALILKHDIFPNELEEKLPNFLKQEQEQEKSISTNNNNLVPIDLQESIKSQSGEVSSPDELLSEPSSSSKESRKTLARVAFMITQSQKDELSEKLGYSKDEIKKLKPMEAVLILKHDIFPNELEEKLPDFLKQEQEQEKNISRNNNNLVSIDLQESIKSQSEEISSPDELLSSESNTSSDPLLLLSSPPSLEENKQQKELEEDMVQCRYQVIQIKKNDNMSEEVIALYPNESEAKFCLETKQILAAKHKSDEGLQFKIRKVTVQ